MAEQQLQMFQPKKGDLHLTVTNFGCTITSLKVTDERGNLADVVLGFDMLTPYMDGTSTYFDCIVGRVANRIKDGGFTLNGKHYSLPVNNGPNTLHGFPGEVDVTATYTLSGEMELRLDMEAIPRNKPTPVSLAQHTYWNLAGHNSGDILGHSVQLWGSHVTPVDDKLIPTGELLPLEGTPFDFRIAKIIRSTIDQVPGGYDHNYVLDCGETNDGLKHVVKVKDPSSSWVLDLWTNAPGMQFYTGNFVNGISGKGGAVYNKHAGLCLKTQGFLNAVNQPNFPSIIVTLGEVYKHSMVISSLWIIRWVK